MHNSYDVEQKNTTYVVRSHNFPEVVATGSTVNEALNYMSRRIDYIKDNEPLRFFKNLQDRKDKNLECMCGQPLTEKPLGFYADGKINHLGN